MKNSCYLVADIGTQSLRVILFDPTGQQLGIEKFSHYQELSKNAEAMELNPHQLWHTFVQACRKLKLDYPELYSQIAAISVTSQRATLVLLDQEQQPVRDAISWLDDRRATDPPKPPLWFRLGAKVAGAAELVDFYCKKSPMNWLREQASEDHAKVAKCCYLTGYFNWMLSGQLVDSKAAQVGFIPYDYKKQQLPPQNHWSWNASGMHPDMLPELVDSATVIGTLTETIAKVLALPNTTKVVASGGDKACEALGSGAINADTASLSFGTAATINVASTRYAETYPWLPAYSHEVSNHYLLEYQLQRGFWLVSWFLKEFGHYEINQSDLTGSEPEQWLDKLLASTPAGAEGLVMQPFWVANTVFPGAEAKGSLIGLTDRHGRAHIYRALIEGIIMTLKMAQQNIESKTRQPINKFVATGGGSNSNGVMQAAADIFNAKVHKTAVSEASGLGAAINCAVACTAYPNHAEAVKHMVHIQQTFEPKSEDSARYQALYQHVFAPMYRQVKPLLKSIQSLGY